MKRKPAPKYTGPTVLGMDISKYQHLIHESMNRIADQNPDLKFCICRTGDGKDADNTFTVNYAAVKAAGIIPGSYHYLRADRDGESQALAMVEALERVKYDPCSHLPPVVDLEDGAQLNLTGGVYVGPNNTMPRQQVHEETLEMLQTLERKLGVIPMLYTGQAFHWWYSQGNPDMAREYARYPLWLPSYGASALMPVDSRGEFFPWKKWTIWQYTSQGTLKGASYKLDLNLFRGSFDDLKNFISNSQVVQPALRPTEQVTTVPSIVETNWEQLVNRVVELQAANNNLLNSPVAKIPTTLSTLNNQINELVKFVGDVDNAFKKDK